MKTDKSFEKLIDSILNKDLPKEPLPPQESFDKFIERVSGKSSTKK